MIKALLRQVRESEKEGEGNNDLGALHSFMSHFMKW